MKYPEQKRCFLAGCMYTRKGNKTVANGAMADHEKRYFNPLFTVFSSDMGLGKKLPKILFKTGAFDHSATHPF